MMLSSSNWPLAAIIVGALAILGSGLYPYQIHRAGDDVVHHMTLEEGRVLAGIQ
jgi:hypothetical protein